MTVIHFATCVRVEALGFIQQRCPHVTDTPESAGPLLDLVAADIVRIQDPFMHGQAGVIPGDKFSDSAVTREEIRAMCMKIMTGEKK